MQNKAVTPLTDLLWYPASYFERLDFKDAYAHARPVEVELGCGDSNFIVQLAQKTPEHNFLGVERLMGRISKLDRKGRRLKLANLRGMRIEAAYFLEYLLPFESVTALHVYFPDPWPKRKHWCKRLVNERFTELAQRILVPGGVVYLRTDDVPYYQQMVEVFGMNKNFVPVETPQELAELLTDFEKEWLAIGKQTNRAAYQRIN